MGMTEEIMKELQELLQLTAECDNLNADDSLEMTVKPMKRDLILKKHTAKIWQGTGKDTRWKTHVPPDNKIIARKTREELLDYLADYYSGQIKNTPDFCTVETLYPEWLDYKSLHTDASTTIRRLDDDWRRFYTGTEITTIPVKELTKLQLDIWAHQIVKDNHLTKKQYYNMVTIMKQVLLYAVDKGIIAESPFKDVKVSPKLFQYVPKQKSDTQVFLLEDQQEIIKEAYKDFEKRQETSALAIILLFATGMRVGEIVALKYSDVEEKHLYIQRMEVKVHQKNDDGSWGKRGYDIADHTKSPAGMRKVFLTQEARAVLKLIKESNYKNGYSDTEGYMFLNKKGRIQEGSIDRKLRTLCRRIGIEEKSPHKIRKTYISTLIDQGVNLNTIREMVGHEDERVTLKNYCFDRRNAEQIEEQIEKALASSQ